MTCRDWPHKADYHAWAQAVIARLTAEAARHGWTMRPGDGNPATSGTYYVRFAPVGADLKDRRAFTVRIGNHRRGSHSGGANFDILPSTDLDKLLPRIIERFTGGDDGRADAATVTQSRQTREKRGLRQRGGAMMILPMKTLARPQRVVKHAPGRAPPQQRPTVDG